MLWAPFARAAASLSSPLITAGMPETLPVDELLSADTVDWDAVVDQLLDDLRIEEYTPTSSINPVMARILQLGPPTDSVSRMVKMYTIRFNAISNVPDTQLVEILATIVDDQSFDSALAVCPLEWRTRPDVIHSLFIKSSRCRVEMILKRMRSDAYISDCRFRPSIAMIYDRTSTWEVLRDLTNAVFPYALEGANRTIVDQEESTFFEKYNAVTQWCNGASESNVNWWTLHIQTIMVTQAPQVFLEVSKDGDTLLSQTVFEPVRSFFPAIARMRLTGREEPPNAYEDGKDLILAMVHANPDALLQVNSRGEIPLNGFLIYAGLYLTIPCGHKDGYPCVLAALTLCQQCLSLRPEAIGKMSHAVFEFVAIVARTLLEGQPGGSKVVQTCHSLLALLFDRSREAGLQLDKELNREGDTPAELAFRKFESDLYRPSDNPIAKSVLGLVRCLFTPAVVVARDKESQLPLHRGIRKVWHIDLLTVVAKASHDALLIRLPETRLLAFQETALLACRKDDNDVDHVDRIYRLLRMAPEQATTTSSSQAPSFLDSPDFIAAVLAQLESERVILASVRQKQAARRDMELLASSWRNQEKKLT